MTIIFKEMFEKPTVFLSSKKEILRSLTKIYCKAYLDFQCCSNHGLYGNISIQPQRYYCTQVYFLSVKYYIIVTLQIMKFLALDSYSQFWLPYLLYIFPQIQLPSVSLFPLNEFLSAPQIRNNLGGKKRILFLCNQQ